MKVLPVKLTGYPPRRMKGVKNETIRKDIPSDQINRKVGN
jgi:hypothetical protein